MLAWATSLNMFKTSTVLLMNSNKNAPVIHSLFFYVLLKYFCPWSLATTPWNNEAIVSKVWNLCLCFSLSPSCCLFLVFALFVGCTFFLLFCGVFVVTGSQLRELRKAKQRFWKGFWKCFLKTSAQALICLIPPNNTGTCQCFILYPNMQHNLPLVPFISVLFGFPSLFLALLSCSCSPDYPPPLPWVFRPFFGITHSLLFYPLFYCLGPLFLFFYSLFITFISFFVSPISLFWPQFYYLNVCHVSCFTFFFLSTCVLVSCIRQNYWY